ncbi:Short chain dehydrogenase [Roseomonas mucosa]|uniref:General stress protein 39 n=2 Tax=Roseomonas TaxID=125216 RepID=A0A1S8D5J1_9PROT|nr:MULTISPECIES: SDR family oxidoreductase [Roseomonas]ATR19822.1 NAD(P)-dependent oxidoreductase [Roseomonas sp. FDAARGOS_362]MBS5901452.1 SDR family oxidoreductase [Acetobacteraceae bacterium]MCG7353360.1 SDR family oxidoreductase [Roseomonas mucosa]MCG7357764.1 SDR family oxidoreductase [Roseomonas mucosa]MDT8291959.1 SDR family oxidoreductase [Roseomonas mucosa]
MYEEMQKVPPQKQDRQPGLESEMTPKPAAEMRHWKGSGKLAGRKAIVTGGDSGIGRAVAIGFAKEGADVFILYKDEHEDAAETKRLVEAEGRRCDTVAGDVGDPGFARSAVEKAAAFLGGIDILVNNAGEQHENKDFATIEEAQVERTFRTNILGYMWMAKYVLPHLKEGSTIVNTTSVTAYRGSPHLVDYSATKGAILAFTRSLAAQLAERKIRVNGVAPGPIWTPLIPASFSPEEVEKHGGSTPLERRGQPDECAPAYIFLASDADSSYITGQVIHPNGGEPVNG